MAKAEIHPGNCGFTTTVEATMDGDTCKLSITSECKAITIEFPIPDGGMLISIITR
jgi:hypothetical protein